MAKRRERLTFILEPGGLRIMFPPGTDAELIANGDLEAEFGLGPARGPSGLRAEIRKARAAQAACGLMREALEWLTRRREDLERKPDHKIKHGKKAEAFAAGLELGLLGRHRVLGGGTSLGVREAASVVEPEHKLNGPSYLRGWSLGCAILAATEVAAGRPDPRKVWGTDTEADRLWREARESVQ